MAFARAKVEYVLFDMDGLMIDSEKVYTDVTNEILRPFGVEMDWKIKAGCMGKPEREAADYLLSHFPDIPLTIESYLAQRNALQDAAWPHVILLPGIERLVKHLHKHKIPMCVATGSRRRNYVLKTGHLGGVFGLFAKGKMVVNNLNVEVRQDGQVRGLDLEQEKVVCADDPAFKAMGMRGKPEGDVFLIAAREVLGRDVGPLSHLGTPSQEHIAERKKGLVFEDALPGLEAGKNAGMNVVWIPDQRLLEATGGASAIRSDMVADQTLGSLEGFIPEEWGLPPFD